MSLLILVFLSLLPLVSTNFVNINEKLEFGWPKFPDGSVIAMYTKNDSPTGDIEPYVEIDLIAKSINGTKMTGFFEVILLQSINHLDSLGYHDQIRYPDFFGTYCCTQEMYDVARPRGCSWLNQINTLLIDDRNRHHQSKRIYFNDSHEVRMKNKLRFSINNTGEHILILSNCDPGLRFGVQVDGEGEWRNPYGYLPGRLYGYLEFYGYMSCVYAVIGLIWYLFNAYHWTEVRMVQNGITVVLAMCMIEMTVWYFSYKTFNDAGTRDVMIVVIGTIITITRDTWMRILILCISLGWGIIPSALENHKFRMTIFSFIYWLLEIIFELITRYPQKSYSEQIRQLLAIPIMILNIIFFGWIMKSLNHRRKQTTCNLYRPFILVFIASILMRIVFGMYQIHFLATDQFFSHWSQLWLIDIGFSLIVYTILLITITILWRPHTYFRQYGYGYVYVLCYVIYMLMLIIWCQSSSSQNPPICI